MPNNIVDKGKEKMWKKAKEITNAEKPELKGEDFYRYTMGIFKGMTKKASDDEIVEELFNEGVLSRTAKLAYYENKRSSEIINDVLEKDAGIKSMATNMWNENKHDFGKGLAYGGGLAAVGVGGVLANKGYNAFKSHLLRNSRLKKITQFDPSIKEMDPALVKATMKDVERLNPDYANSPLITGNILKSVQSWGGLGVDQANIIKDKDKQRTVSDLFAEGFKARPKPKGDSDFKGASEKEADDRSFSQRMSDGWTGAKGSLGTSFKNPLVQGALAIGAGAAAISGAHKLINNMTRNKRVGEMKQLYPGLAKADDGKILAALKSVEKINPTFGTDPNIAGGYVSKIMKDKGFLPATAQGLADAKGNLGDSSPFTMAKTIFGKD